MVRTNQRSTLYLSPSSLSPFLTPSSHHVLHHLCHTLPSCPSIPLSYPVHPPLPFFIPPFPLSLPSYPLSSSLSGITMVDETSPVDEPSDSDQVTEGVKFAYTLPHQQSNQEDSQDDTALVCVHQCACVLVCMCTWMCVGLYVHVDVYFGVYIFKFY